MGARQKENASLGKLAFQQSNQENNVPTLYYMLWNIGNCQVRQIEMER
jgi:hypothetical protein